MNNTLNSQEKIAGALAYIFFFLPAVLGNKTDFTMFHARQAFGIFLIFFAIRIITALLPFIGGTIAMIFTLILTVVSLFLAYKAYMGEQFVLSSIYSEKINMLINRIGLNSFFSK